MPTAAKLVAAIILAITGYFTVQAVYPFLKEGQPDNWLLPVSVVVPIICAWRTTGRLVGKSYWAAANSGIYGLCVSVFFVVFTFAASEMLTLSMRKRYDGPMEAIVSMFGIWVEMAQRLLHVPVLIVLISGGVLAGLAAEWAHRKWR